MIRQFTEHTVKRKRIRPDCNAIWL
jgi:hypothetical protein